MPPHFCLCVSASLIDHPILYCKYGSFRLVWCAGVVSIGNAAEEVPTEVSAAYCKLRWIGLSAVSVHEWSNKAIFTFVGE